DSYLPAAAIVDHELSLTMPPRLTADTGIDALTHAVEAYVSRRTNPVSDALALAAMGLIGRHLRAAFHDGDRHAREQMMTAATLAGMAFSNASVALVHGMSRPLGAHFHIAHGLANAMLFAEVASFSVPAAVQRYAACARAMGIGSDAHTHAELAALLVDELRGLSRDLGVPTPPACAAADGLSVAVVAGVMVPAAVRCYGGCARATGTGWAARTHAELAGLLADARRGLSRDRGVPTPAEGGVCPEASARL